MTTSEEAHRTQTPRMPAFNPQVEESRADPYRLYRHFRQSDPVHCAVAPASAGGQGAGFWYLFRHEDVAAALKDPRLGRQLIRGEEAPRLAGVPEERRPFYEMAGKWMLYRDPPDHTRLRSLVNKAFLPRVVQSLRPRLQVLAEGLLDVVEPDGAMDVIADYAFSLSLLGVGALLGVRGEDQARFREWSSDLSKAIDQSRNAGVYEQASRATVSLSAYFREILDERRLCPQEDLMSGLISAEEQGGHLTEDEVVACCILLLGAGQETTADLIGNSVLALLRHPEQLKLLRERPQMLPSAIEELLRFDSPVQMTARVAQEDMEIGGRLIEKGAKITLVLGSANHDPEVFPEPDRLDLTRHSKAHLSFGLGIHFCLGTSLAHMGAQVALSTLLRRAPGLRLEAHLSQHHSEYSPEWRQGPVFRGLERLPVLL